MNPTAFSASALIPAPAPQLYAILADYREGHPRILPRPPFVTLQVEEGGIGDGTVIRVGMKILGREQIFRAVITEPEPGRVLMETNEDGYETTFTVEPQEDGLHARVTITTMASKARGMGLRGLVEGWFVRRLLLPVYRLELELLASVAAERGTSLKAAVEGGSSGIQGTVR